MPDLPVRAQDPQVVDGQAGRRSEEADEEEAQGGRWRGDGTGYAWVDFGGGNAGCYRWYSGNYYRGSDSGSYLGRLLHDAAYDG